MENIYHLNPLKVHILNILNNTQEVYIFLGKVPTAILDAANAGYPEWDPKHSKILQKFYGSKWKTILSPINKKQYTGGNDFDDFDDITIDTKTDTIVFDQPIDTNIKTNKKQVNYVDISIYPEDTLDNLKDKIFVATGIDYCKQHLFQYEDGSPQTTYQLLIDGAEVKTNIVDIIESIKHKRDDIDYISGIPIDKSIEKYKEDLIIDAMDIFTNMESHPTDIYVVNIDIFINNIEKEIKQIIKDKYKFDLFYFGFVLKYWPSIPSNAFKMMVLSPKELSIQYPYLFKSLKKVKNMISAEQEIINNIYNRSKETKLRYSEIVDYGGIAITKAKINIRPQELNSLLNIRNIFEIIKTNGQLPAIMANMQSFDMGIIDHKNNYVLEKTHISSNIFRYGPGASKDLDQFLDKPLKDQGVSFVIVKDDIGKGNVLTRKPHFIYLTIYLNGKYSIESTWNEVERVDFKQIISQMTKSSKHILEEINKYKPMTIPLGNHLQMPSENKTDINSMTICVYWPHAFTNVGFKNLRLRLRRYEDAGIISIKPVQQPGTYSFNFLKNMIDYESNTAIERRLFTTGNIKNKYNYLSNSDARSVWDSIYFGKSVKLYQKSTVLKIEISNVNMSEFKFISTYMLTFLDSLLYGSDKIEGIVSSNVKNKSVGRLRSLQEKDPNLYKLKQFDNNATSYSILCQGERQPEILTKKEAKKYKKSEITKFWNFTDHESAYYRCPSKNFPYLQFNVGKHPLGYCLPCCKKTNIIPNSRSELRTKKCLTDYKVDASKTGIKQNTRHILSYGKETEVGRISYAPSSISYKLLYNSLEHPFVYRLIGVNQTTKTMPSAGFFYALASAFEYESHDFVKEIVDTVNMLGDSYISLAEGAASVFRSPAELINTIVDTFIYIEGGPVFSHFGPGGMAHKSWKKIITSIIRIRFNIEILEFVDIDNSIVDEEIDENDPGVYSIDGELFKLGLEGKMQFVADSVSIDKLRNSKKTPYSFAIIVTNKYGSYPFVAMDQKAFMKHTRGYGPARRFFSSTYDDGEFKDTVISELRDMVMSEVKIRCNISPNKYLDLNMITKICEENNYHIEYQLINLRSMCYGIIIKNSDEDNVYFPIPYSPSYLKPKIEGKSAAFMYYGARPNLIYPPESLNTVFKTISGYLGLQVKFKMMRDGKNIGFICDYECNESSTLIFYHDPSSKKSFEWSNAPETNIPYNMNEIDELIYGANGNPDTELPEKDQQIANEGIYKNNMYKLFITEFISGIKDLRNKKIRQKIIKLIKENKMQKTTEIKKFYHDLDKLLNNDNNDFNNDIWKIKKIIKTCKNGSIMRNELIKNIESDVFDFDREVISELRNNKSIKCVKDGLDKIIKPKIHFIGDSDASNIDIKNIYTACSTSLENQSQCYGKKLKMIKSKYNAFISILASDIMNPGKKDLIYLLSSGIVDMFNFTSDHGETIKIKKQQK
jgi:hypothetical protein